MPSRCPKGCIARSPIFLQPLSLRCLLMTRLTPARDLDETAVTHVMRAPIFFPYFFLSRDGKMEPHIAMDEMCFTRALHDEREIR